MSFMGLTRNRGGWFKSQRESRRLRGLTMDYELVTKGDGTGESTRKVKDEPGADMPNGSIRSQKRREKNAEESASWSQDKW